MISKKIFIKNKKQQSLDKTRGRLMLLSACFFILYSIVAARVFDLTILQGKVSGGEESYFVEASKGLLSKVRADVVDRNGVILARSLSMPSLYADPKLIAEPEKAAKEIVEIFPTLTYGSILKKLQENNRFTWIKRNIEPADQAKINNLGRPGLSFKQETKRIYPQEALMSHIVGVSGVDGQGLSGVERSFNQLLTDQNKKVEISLDVRIQHILKREMSKTIKLHEAKGGAGVVMDVNTGEILAITSLPDFNPYQYNKEKNDNLFNKATLGVYEMGSTFKILSIAAMIEKDKNNFLKKYDATKPIKIGRFQIRDYHPEKRSLSLPEVFVHSSNIGTALMAQEMGSDYLRKFYEKIGLLNMPSFEISEIGQPMVPSSWSNVHNMTASYGHGIAVSPLQLVKASASIVNGGYVVEPTLIKNHLTVGHKNTVVSPETSHRMRQLLRLNVSHGTGSKADVKGYLVGGKTGTAEKPGKSGGYDRKRLISSFLAFFPMDEPKYAVFVMIDEPKGIKQTYGYATGGWVGAPTVSRVIASMTSVLGMKPRENNREFGDDLLKYVKTEEQIKKERQIAAH